MEKISVIVPFYNPPLSQLRLCLKSLVHQIGVEYELILVNDGSTEDVQSIVKKYKNSFSEIKLLNQNHKGVGAARNLGLKKATGDYIVFCDADDYVENNYLAALLEAIQRADLAICGVTEQFFPVIDSYVDMRIFSSFPSEYNQLQYVNFSVNKIFRKEIISRIGLSFKEDVALGEDALFIAEYLKHCRYIRTISSNLYHYLLNIDSAVHLYQPDYWDWEKQVIGAQFRQFTTFPLNDREKQYMQYWAFNKIRGAVNYFATNEKNPTVLKAKLYDISTAPVYKYLFQNGPVSKNPFFKLHEKIMIRIWKKFGMYTGMQMKKKALLLKKII